MIKKEEIKVLIIPSWYPPDGGGFFKDHAEALNEGHYKVHVLVNRVLGLTKHSLRTIIESRKMTEHVEGGLTVFRSGYLRWPRLVKRNVKGWIKRFEEIFEMYVERRGTPDIIIAHSTIWGGYVAARIKAEFDIPFILVEHRSRFAKNVEAAQEMIREWYFPYIRNCLVNADRIVTVSQAIDNQLISISPGIRNKILTIPNLIDTDFFDLPEKERKMKPYTFLAFGILEHVKGFDVLIQAFSEFVKKNSGEYYLRIGGRGSKSGKLSRLAKRYGVKDRVILHGYVPREEVRKEMQMANLFILPSRFEAFGVVLIEAMATGCPVISTYSGGPEYIVKEKNGLLVEPNDPGELEKAMTFIYKNPEKYDPNIIREDVVKKYSYGVIRNKYHSLINEVLNEKGISTE